MQSKIISRFGISRRNPDQTLVLCGRQDHACVHAQEMSELIGPSPPQWLVDLFGLCELAWRQARPSRSLLTNVRPEAFPVVENLLIEVSPVISIGQPRWILLQAIDDRLRNGRFICRQVRGKVGIRHVEEQEIYEIDRRGSRMVRKLHWLSDPREASRAAQRADHRRGKPRWPSVMDRIATTRVC